VAVLKVYLHPKFFCIWSHVFFSIVCAQVTFFNGQKYFDTHKLDRFKRCYDDLVSVVLIL